MGLGTGVAVLNSQAVPISQVVTKTGFTVLLRTYGSPTHAFVCFYIPHIKTLDPMKDPVPYLAKALGHFCPISSPFAQFTNV